MVNLRRRDVENSSTKPKKIANGNKNENADEQQQSSTKTSDEQGGDGGGWCGTLLKIGLLVVCAPPLLNCANLSLEKPFLVPENHTLYDIGFGQKLHMKCMGHGKPTVIIDGPAGMLSDVLYPLQEQLSELAKVCVYDRAGLGNSDWPPHFNMSDPNESAVAGPTPHTTNKMVQDLRRLVQLAGVGGGGNADGSSPPPPMMLIGSQLGALNMLAYAASFPDQVGQLVLIDPLHLSMYSEGQEWSAFAKNSWIPFQRTMQVTAAYGINRLGASLGLIDHASPCGTEPVRNLQQGEGGLRLACAKLQHFLCDFRQLGAAAAEVENLEVSAKQVGEVMATSSAFRTPTAVITGNYYDELLPKQLNRAWAVAAQKTVSSIPECQHYVINGADHKMIYQKPGEVLQPIKRLLKKLKNKVSSNGKTN